MKKTAKRGLAALLLLLAMAFFLPSAGMAQAAEAGEFLAGSGTEADPYLISTIDHLWNVYKYPSAHFRLLCDLDLTCTRWTAISTFSGTFDGGGFTISNMNYAASFITTLNGTVKNLNLGGSFTTAAFADTVGTSGVISNCGSSAYISVSGANVGGIAGTNKGLIELCANSGTVFATSGGSKMGGIVGHNEGTVDRCYNRGNVESYAAIMTTNSYTGGIVGYGGTVTDCFNMGTVIRDGTSINYHGGIAGGGADVIRCYNSGVSNGSHIGGGAQDCYFISYDNDSVNGATALTRSQMKVQANFPAFDFDSTWVMDEGDYGMPILKGVYFSGISSNTEKFAGGNGTYYAPYEIANEAHLKNVTSYLSSYFIVTEDITLTRANWSPIGGKEAFTGFFDGNGHTISGLYYNVNHRNTSTDNAIDFGLFYDNDGTVRDLTLKDVSITGGAFGQHHAYVGAFAATGSGCFYNCSVEGGSVSALTYYNSNYGGAMYNGAGYTYVGGIVGYPTNADIIGCRNSASVSGSTSAGGMDKIGSEDVIAGGIVGYATSCAVKNCINSGDVSAYAQYSEDYVLAGGIAGSGTSLINCRNSGYITADTDDENTYGVYAGGISGMGTEFTGCVNSGTVKGMVCKYTVDLNIGGITGSGGTLTDCLNTGMMEYDLGGTYNRNYMYIGGLAGSATKIITSYDGAENILVDFLTDEKDTTCIVENSYLITDYAILHENIGREPQKMLSQEGYDGFDFNMVWAFDPMSDYPYAVPAWTLTAPLSVSIPEGSKAETPVDLAPDLSAITATVAYEGGQTVEMPLCGWMVPAMKLGYSYADYVYEITGTYELGVCISGVYADNTLELTVRAAVPTSLEINTLPAKLSYKQNLEELDLSGGTFNIVYDNGTTEKVAMSRAEVAGFDNSISGKQTLTLTYSGMTVTFEIDIAGITGIEVYSGKMDYVQYQPLDLSFIDASAVYSDGSYVTIPAEELTFEYDKSIVSSITYQMVPVTATWNGFTSVFEIYVSERVVYSMTLTQPEKLSHCIGEPLDLEGGYLTVVFDSYDDYTEEIPLTPDMISGYDPMTKGVQTVTVTYLNKTATYIVYVRDLIASADYTIAKDGITVDLTVSLEDTEGYTFYLAAYRGGRMVDIAICAEPDPMNMSFEFDEGLETDTYVLYTVGHGYVPHLPFQNVIFS